LRAGCRPLGERKNVDAQLGDGTTTARRTPGPVSGLATVVALYGGPLSNATCARTASGGVKCWGRNTDGEIDGTLGSSLSTPVDVPELANAASIAFGGYHLCAGYRSGIVKCSGRGEKGELGDGLGTNRGTRALVIGIEDAVEVVSGTYFSCARHASAGVSCWGGNSYGALGDGTYTNRFVPVRVAW
jgi:alpha-tubulin suppressor-like RCC1 family protein